MDAITISFYIFLLAKGFCPRFSLEEIESTKLTLSPRIPSNYSQTKPYAVGKQNSS
jgi:hypothetical protein